MPLKPMNAIAMKPAMIRRSRPSKAGDVGVRASFGCRSLYDRQQPSDAAAGPKSRLVMNVYCGSP